MRSMTGYGRGKAAGEQWEVDVVIRSVNHRFLDPAIRLNREQSFLEETIRRCLADAAAAAHPVSGANGYCVEDHSTRHGEEGSAESV